MDVIVLGSNRPPERFYRGGPKIAAFRHEPPAGEREPEDWVGSTTALAGEDTLGVTVLPGGRSLPAAIAADPEAWLGRAHLERFGADTRLLVKLLDAGQRLPVHAHPHASFAGQHLGRAHGFAVLVILTGEAETAEGQKLGAGSTVLIPYAASPYPYACTSNSWSAAHRPPSEPG